MAARTRRPPRPAQPLRLALSAALLAALIGAALPALLQPASAQPARWDIRAAYLPYGLEVLPLPGLEYPLWLMDPGKIGPGDEERYRSGEVYPGEPANLTFHIVNTDCSRREEGPRVLNLGRTWLDDVEPMLYRADDLNRTGFIRDYELYGYNVEGFGERLRADWELRIYGYCAGDPVHVESATVWFAWRGIGKSINATARIERTLKALDPIAYVLRRDVNSSSAVFTVRFPFPPTVPPDELEREPTLTLRLRYPSGFTYEYDYTPTREGLHVWGFSRVAYTKFRLYPYRTFNIHLRDHEGRIPLPGAEVQLKAHIYPFKTNATAGEDGVARIWRLPDYYTYEITVNYTVPWLGEERTVLVGSPYEAYELALAGELRTELYTLRVSPIDRQGRALEGARVAVRPERGAPLLENSSRDGYASFYLLPTGNYTIHVEWRGVTVFRGHRYVGVHPTLGFPSLSPRLTTSVDDLVVRATDMAGNPVGAVFTVRGPTDEASLSGVEAPDGLLRLPQMPIADYAVTAANRSRAFGVAVEATGEARPGEPLEIRLPIFGVSLRAVSMDGKPLAGASIRLHTLTASADSSGAAVFPGVPEGAYEVEVTYGGASVYSGRLEVRGNVDRGLDCAVYDVRVRFETADGKPIVVRWSLAGAGREHEGTGEGLAIELLPEQEYRLTATITRDGREVRLLERAVRPSELRGAAIRLPIADLRIRIAWDDGTPFEGQAVVLGESRRVVGGELALPSLPFGQYNVSLLSWGVEVLRREVTHEAGEATITLPSLKISVRVVDALGRPVEGAGVSLQSPRAPGGTVAASTTGREGTVGWSRLPAALEPYWIVVSYAGHMLEQQAQPGENVVALPGIVAGGMLIGTGALIGVAAALGTAATLAFLMMRIRRRAGTGTEE